MAGIRKRDERTDESTDKQRQTNMLHQHFQNSEGAGGGGAGRGGQGHKIKALALMVFKIFC